MAAAERPTTRRWLSLALGRFLLFFGVPLMVRGVWWVFL